MEEALQSIARAFARNREATPLLEVGLLVLLLVVLTLQLGGLARRWARRRTALLDLASRHGLSAEELHLVRELAGLTGAQPAALFDHLDTFEKASARALAERPGPDLPARLRRLRHAFGFDRLPPHAPLLSTRELMPGTALDVAGLLGQTFDVAEDAFSVELREAPPLEVGETVALGLIHAREARYALRCRLLSAHGARQGRWRLTFAHDEAPVRIQQREFARVPARGPVSLRPRSAATGRAEAGRELRAELVDVSGGGALVTGPTQLPVGLLAGASFAVGDAAFGNLRAVVLGSERGPDGRWRSHLEFGPMAEAERARLVAAVERLELAHQPARLGA